VGEGFGKKVTNFKTITNLTERKGFNYLQIMSSRAPCAFLSRKASSDVKIGAPFAHIIVPLILMITTLKKEYLRRHNSEYY